MLPLAVERSYAAIGDAAGRGGDDDDDDDDVVVVAAQFHFAFVDGAHRPRGLHSFGRRPSQTWELAVLTQT